MLKIIIALALLSVGALAAHAQGMPAVNSVPSGCADGRGLMYINGNWTCSSSAAGQPGSGNMTCGSGPSVAGSDFIGTISVGTGVVTSCVMPFSRTLSAAPTCVISTNSASVAGGVTTATTSLTIALSATLGGGKIFYMCAIP
jgi:hypothetical protein